MAHYAWVSIGGLAALLTSLGFLPQVLKMWQRRSVGDVSLATLVQFAVGVTLWTLYGFYIGDPVVVIANIVTLVTLIAGLVSYFRFRRLRAIPTEDRASQPGERAEAIN